MKIPPFIAYLSLEVHLIPGHDTPSPDPERKPNRAHPAHNDGSRGKITARRLMAQQRVEEEIRLLLYAVKTLAVSSYSTLHKRYPELSKFDLDSWDFFMTVAGLYAAVMRLKVKLGPQEIHQYIPFLEAEIDAWDRLNGVRALLDCDGFVNRGLPDEVPDSRLDREALLAYALGMWVLWNLYQSEPPGDHRELAQAIGGMMFCSFANWWV